MNIAIILAGGTGSRFGSDKLAYNLGNKTVLQMSIEKYENHKKIDKVLVVGEKILGGKTRFQSLQNGIEYCKKNFPSDTKILVHNGANPFVTPEEITEVITTIEKNTAVGVGQKITGTIRKISPDTNKSNTIDRENIFEMQTPQGAVLKDFVTWINFYNTSKNSKNNKKTSEITDELSLAEFFGAKTKIIPASKQNIKITTKADIRQKENNYSNFPVTGLGIDSHSFENQTLISAKKCMLCGIEIKNSPAFKGNSDADVALHAISNAILSALGKNSFSSIADKLCKKGITDSSVYLQKILDILQIEEKKILHISLTFEGKSPKVEKYFTKFRTKLSKLLCLSPEKIGLNATTGEGLDGYAQGNGMKVTTLVTIL